jgi:siroheme synthase (precorrin-2 oxidase/ferrochelatase)
MNDVENKKFRSAIRAHIKEEMPKRIKQMKEETKKEIENGRISRAPSNEKYKEWASRALKEEAYKKLHLHTPRGRIENLRSKFKQGLSDKEKGK